MNKLEGMELGFGGSHRAGLGQGQAVRSCSMTGCGELCLAQLATGLQPELLRLEQLSYMQTRQEGPSGKVVAGRDWSCGSLVTTATLLDTRLPVSAPYRTQSLPNLLVTHPPFTERMHSSSLRRVSRHDVDTAKRAAGKESSRGLLF